MSRFPKKYMDVHLAGLSISSVLDCFRFPPEFNHALNSTLSSYTVFSFQNCFVDSEYKLIFEVMGKAILTRK